MPDWQERHVPDLGIALVEVLAYVGDYLSYYQDAVATEAYLDTARRRISVRRHARLVDYTHARRLQRPGLGDVWVSQDLPLTDPECYLITNPGLSTGGTVLTIEELPSTSRSSLCGLRAAATIATHQFSCTKRTTRSSSTPGARTMLPSQGHDLGHAGISASKSDEEKRIAGPAQRAQQQRAEDRHPIPA